MTIPLSQGLSDGTGAPGQRIIRAMIAGERAPRPLAAFRHSRGQKDAEDIALALTGTWRTEQLLVLQLALALGAFSTAQRNACAGPIAQVCSVITPCCESPADLPLAPPPAAPPRRKPPAQSQNAPAGHPRAHLLRLTGVARVAVHGSSAAMAQTIGSEIGTDMSQWPDDQHVCSWLGLAPKPAIAGGTGRKSRTMQNRHRAAPAFRMAAPSVLRADGASGACSRHFTGRRGPAQALVATAHTIARTVDHMRRHHVPYHDIGALEYNKRFRARALQSLQKQAAKLGYKLTLA
jgi:hypothetical protein